MAPRGERFVRIVGEFAVICAGVLAALVADDWREGREQRALGDRALVAILADLAADSAVLANLVESFTSDDHAAARLLAHADDPLFPTDSVESYLYAFYQGAPYAPSRAGFSLAVGTGALQYVQGDSLRVAIVQYFEQASAMFGAWYTELVAWGEALTDQLRPRFRPRLAPQTASLFPIQWGARRLQASWNELRRDDVLMHHVFDFGTYAGEFANDSRERLRQNLSLQALIRAEVGIER